MQFEIIPAVDIMGGKVVRLVKGDYSEAKIYSDEPIEIICRFAEAGFNRIHVVDLDGAREGKPINYKFFKNLKCSAKVQYGGGLRKIEDVESIIECGVYKVVLSSVFFDDNKEFEKIVNKYRNKIMVSLDSYNRYLKIHGWLDNINVKVSDIVATLENYPIEECIVTDISRDGTLKGPDFALYKEIKSITRLKVFASGGVASVEDILKLKKIGIAGVVVGRALYEGKVNLIDAINCLQKE
ncbi:MAG: 1-(5-phosphoribosyl)-5-[(5-phosphoribosylamino)methylideneamino]imidazole-4-carboxamide isomerase [bacterium]|nr:1-(5-phosphoribosyl)-5-[(5-phosphoribosylamino)methylideneamino]imidazole-4-carboxamide isomerase [bacterium]